MACPEPSWRCAKAPSGQGTKNWLATLTLTSAKTALQWRCSTSPCSPTWKALATKGSACSFSWPLLLTRATKPTRSVHQKLHHLVKCCVAIISESFFFSFLFRYEMGRFPRWRRPANYMYWHLIQNVSKLVVVTHKSGLFDVTGSSYLFSSFFFLSFLYTVL